MYLEQSDRQPTCLQFAAHCTAALQVTEPPQAAEGAGHLALLQADQLAKPQSAGQDADDSPAPAHTPSPQTGVGGWVS
jgi:hypothetical protein